MCLVFDESKASVLTPKWYCYKIPSKSRQPPTPLSLLLSLSLSILLSLLLLDQFDKIIFTAVDGE